MIENVHGIIMNLERIAERKCASYDEASLIAKTELQDAENKSYDKVKIFHRNDDSFDVVWYRIIAKQDNLPDVVKVTPSRVHGLPAKERRRRDRKKI